MNRIEFEAMTVTIKMEKKTRLYISYCLNFIFLV